MIEVPIGIAALILLPFIVAVVGLLAALVRLNRRT